MDDSDKKTSGANCLCTRVGFSWQFLGLEFGLRLVLMGVAVCVLLLVEPFVRAVEPMEWENHMYPYTASEKFPNTTAVIIEAGAFLVVWIGWTLVLRFVKKWPPRKVVEEAIVAFLSFSLAAIGTFLITEMMKVLYGGLRPDFLDRCYGPDNRHLWPSPIPQFPACLPWTPDHESIVTDGRQTFPSAHASMTWCGFLWMALYSYGKLSLFRNIGGFRLVVPGAFLMFPLAVVITRTSDYRHFLRDVTAGSILGIVVSALVVTFYHPLYLKPLDRWSGQLYEPPCVLISESEDSKTNNVEV